MSIKRVAVLRGGPSSEYDVSLQSGREVLGALRDIGYPHKDIVITKKGEWLDSGIVKTPEKALEAVDVVFIALHGEYGEDGQVQRIIQRKKIPFTGSNAFTSAIAFNKELTKRSLEEHGMPMPKHRKVDRHSLSRLHYDIDYIRDVMRGDLFIKPVASGSSIGARHVHNHDTLREHLEELLALHESVLVEEYIRGREATVAVVENFRNHDLYVLPAIEIVPPASQTFFSNEVKYNGATQELCPGRFSYAEKARLAELATLAHKALHCEHYSRTDFIVQNGEVYFLEINTLPGLTKESLFPKAAAAVGLEFKDLVQHLVETSKA